MNTKKEVISALCAFAVKIAFRAISANAEKNGQKIEIKCGRKLSVSDFVEYLESVEKTTDIPAALKTYLTLEVKHDFEKKKEEAEKKRAAEAEAEAKMFADLGL